MSEGKPGYCKICAHPQAKLFVEGARSGGSKGQGWNAAEAQEIAEPLGLTFHRTAWYRHQEHARTGEYQMIQAAEVVRRSGVLTVADIKKTSNKDLLEAIRDIGMARAINNPEDVTIDQALKAVQIMEAKKDQRSDSLNILVQFVTGQPPAYQLDDPTIVEGVAREIPAPLQEANA